MGNLWTTVKPFIKTGLVAIAAYGIYKRFAPAPVKGVVEGNGDS